MNFELLKDALKYFFAQTLPKHRGLAKNSIDTYQQTFKQFIPYLQTQLHNRPFSQILISDVTPEHVLGFLDHLEAERGVRVSTRNLRLASIRSFAECLPFISPHNEALARQLLRLPPKRHPYPFVDYLEPEHLELLFRQIDTTSQLGFRDAVMLRFMYNTGGRISEVIGVRLHQLRLEPPPEVTLIGKGSKPRICPLWDTTTAMLNIYLDQRRPKPRPGHKDFLFLTRTGKRFTTRQGLWKRLRRYVLQLERAAPQLKRKNVRPHVIRHTTATHLLQSGVDLSTVSQWLGHEHLHTTQKYTKVDLRAKRQALERFRRLDANRIFLPEEQRDGQLDNKELTEWLESYR